MSTPPLPASIPQPRTHPCKVCGTLSPRLSVVDFAKHCSHTPWHTADPVGIPVIFFRCPTCALIFTTFFDTWSHADFRTYVYNDAYAIFDPDYIEIRPRNTAASIASTFAKRDLKVLDYGGGSGVTAKFLREQGFTNVTVYEPFNPEFAQRPAGQFDLIICVEVLEHSTQPRELAADLASMLAPDGLIYLTTLIQDPSADAAKGEHWYVSPRNGHTHFHSKQSLDRTFAPHQLRIGSANHNLHICFRTVPPWATQLFGQRT